MLLLRAENSVFFSFRASNRTGPGSMRSEAPRSLGSAQRFDSRSPPPPPTPSSFSATALLRVVGLFPRTRGRRRRRRSSGRRIPRVPSTGPGRGSRCGTTRRRIRAPGGPRETRSPRGVVVPPPRPRGRWRVDDDDDRRRRPSTGAGRRTRPPRRGSSTPRCRPAGSSARLRCSTTRRSACGAVRGPAWRLRRGSDRRGPW
mmetsp:Transcript_474/g.1064  ORF Transcript_474/g.1064 Transcript_474/m.1064 type:complete len:201 (-) Transcript_474:542-1144(-)